MPSGHAVLARAVIEAADKRRQVPAERLRGLCEAYVMAAGLSTLIRDEYDMAEVVSRAREDYASQEAARVQIGQPDLTLYLRLTQQQAEADDRMEELTRERGFALAQYRRETGASLEAIAGELRHYGYMVSRSGVKWLIDNSAPR